MYTVYKHTTPSGKRYIGITCRKPEERWENGSGYKGNKHFYRAIERYGWSNIRHEIVADGLTKAQACAMEIKLIAEYDTTDPDKGYNHSTGGESGSLGMHHSAESRRKMSKAKKGANHPNYGKHLNVDVRRKISESNKGRTSPRKGTHLSVETRMKIGKANKGKYVSEETKRKLAESHKGKRQSNETRRKLSIAHKGKKPSAECIRKSIEAHKGKHIDKETRMKISKKLKGKPLSIETRKKMSEARKGKIISEHVILAMTEATSKKVLCVETGEVYKSISEAGRQLDVSFKAISKALRGKSKTSGGYHWEYVE